MSKFFTQGQAVDFIESVFGSGKQSNAGLNISVVCPICKSQKSEAYSKRKLVIRTDNFLTHCWVCGYKARNLLHLLRKFNPRAAKSYTSDFLNAEELFGIQSKSEPEKVLELPESFQLLATAPDTKHKKRLIEYLKSRTSDLERDMWYWRLGYTSYEQKEYRNRIIMPSYNAEGKLNYFTARHVRGFNPKYKNPEVRREDIIFNELNIDWTKPLTIVEGPFDLIKCNDNATCALGSTLDISYKLFQEIVLHKTPITIAYDRDALSKAMKLARSLTEFNIEVKIFTVPSEFEDVGEMSRNQFIELVEHAILYDTTFEFKTRLATLTL